MLGNKSYLHCLQRQQAQERWWQKLDEQGYFEQLPCETVAVEFSLGRITAGSVFARQSVPHYNGAAMDGIALCAHDSFGAQETAPKRLRLLQPGEPFAAGGCYAIDTGDVLPNGTNAVIMIEDVHWADGMAEIIAAAAPWQHVRIIGEDIVAREMVIAEHEVITSADIAALLAAGVEAIEVIQRPKVAIIPTGDEIVASREELQAGKILDINSPMLAAALTSWGATALRRPIVKDERRCIVEAMEAALRESDMVIVIAGTSAGRDDYTADVLSELGEVLVHGVAMKPGKPVILAVCQGKPVIGLPGYPVSAMLTAELFLRDVAQARQKLPLTATSEETVTASLVKPVPSTIGMEEYLRVSVGQVEGKTIAVPVRRGAGLISSLTKAQGIMRIDAADAGVNTSTPLPIRLLRHARPAQHTILAVGSHDLALEILGVYLRRRMPHVSLSCANVGSMGGIMAIRNHEAHIAGIHMLDEATGQYNLPFVQRYVPGFLADLTDPTNPMDLTNPTGQTERTGRLIHLALRQQGLIVPPGNPLGIHSLADLTRPGLTFVNRQRGSGTRMLLDKELGKANIDGCQINGYEKEVATHMAVAASVLSGTADAGLGVQAAAQALGLAFIPIAQEQYDLLLNFSPDDERLQAIIEILHTMEFRREIEALGGYSLCKAGETVQVQ
ncbi:molybdopterin biosynthesis protein [Heliophilum fasciatum]|uniref:Molybdopterin molybdenumtransferase n=1 Tax=Heliophilum fasciatum TaxID=35700 RepID=A0A4R2RLI3_9FIRM|nr:molybdopterin biosynthesis protein [Heliophilum fasciatum]MCW2278196.1 putative molybdopterin biosynthesis protein [Heliophilum fasciatum]TCP63983.1 molybdopterin molybdochelatase [Heliophilum fasciatum]